MLATIIICVVLAAAGVYGAISYRKRLTSGCCGSAGGPVEKKHRVKDKDPSHYPFRKCLKIDGMSCSNCVNHVENALNGIEGVWAKEDLMSGSDDVRMKEGISDQVLKQTVKDAGYQVYKILPGDGN